MATRQLSPDFIAKQRERLQALRAELMTAETAAAAEAVVDEQTRGAEAKEYEEAAQALDRREVLQAKHEVDQGRLALIDLALRKIERGTYGVSEVSGKPIPQERLEAMPEAVMTTDEAAAKE